VVISEKNLIDKDMVTNSFFKATKKKSASAEKSELETKQHIAELGKNAADANVIPDLKNLSLREALQRASLQNISLKARGEGLVSEIIPEPGSQVPSSRKIMVILKPVEEIH
jgi:multidrug resistance efflux pump